MCRACRTCGKRCGVPSGELHLIAEYVYSRSVMVYAAACFGVGLHACGAAQSHQPKAHG